MAYTSLKKAVERQLADIRSAGLYKTERQLIGPQAAEIHVAHGQGQRAALNFCANNYLGLANHPALRQAALDAVERYGAGSASVRTIAGMACLHAIIGPRTFTAYVRSHTVIGVDTTSPSSGFAALNATALLTRMSSRPHFSTHASIAPVTAARVA